MISPESVAAENLGAESSGQFSDVQDMVVVTMGEKDVITGVELLGTYRSAYGVVHIRVYDHRLVVRKFYLKAGGTQPSQFQ